MEGVPRITAVQAISPTELHVRFDNAAERIYDCRSILARPEFQLLRTLAFFRAVKVDPGGYGISWNDDMDLSGWELWTNGKPVADHPKTALSR